jgi:hypothetical protein
MIEVLNILTLTKCLHGFCRLDHIIVITQQPEFSSILDRWKKTRICYPGQIGSCIRSRIQKPELKLEIIRLLPDSSRP